MLSVIDAQKEYLDIVQEHKVIRICPFNSANKYSYATVSSQKKTRTYYTGAPEVLLKHVRRYMDEHGKLRTIDKKMIASIVRKNAIQAKRMVALAYCDGVAQNVHDKNSLILTALISIRDEVRKEVPAAVQSMYDAGIQVIMITGDNIDTAYAIARDSGIVRSKQDIAITASELDKMSDKEVKEKLPLIRIIARALPDTKLRIVKLAQELNLSIGMCGDGTNDAPALKKADVGFAMGSGTSVCKEAGDIIITDDNFVSVTDAVLFGRTFMKNIKKFLMFQLPINLTLLLVCLGYPVLIGGEALIAAQILVINIVVDSLNSLAFGAEPVRREYMLDKPLDKGASLLSPDMRQNLMFTVSVFCVVFALTMTPFFQTLFDNSPDKNLAARFALFMLLAVANGFCVRTEDTHLMRGIKDNPMFIIIAAIILTGAFLLIKFGGATFGGAEFSILQWAVLVIMASVLIPLDIIRKKIIHD